MTSLPCSACHMKQQQIKPVTDCASCHPKRSELHLKATHAATDCVTCHIPHEWKAATREVCYSCHTDKSDHNPQGVCKDCHPFRQPAGASEDKSNSPAPAKPGESRPLPTKSNEKEELK